MVTGVIRTPRAERYVRQPDGHWGAEANITVADDGAHHVMMANGAEVTLHPEPGVLVVESSTKELGDVVLRHLARFGMCEGLALEWRGHAG